MKNVLRIIFIVLVIVCLACSLTACFETATVYDDNDTPSYSSRYDDDDDDDNGNDNATMGEKMALSSAKNYLRTMGFSKKGLIEQLEFEGYTTSEATYAVNHCGANWKEQAVRVAKNYLKTMSFSKQGLIEQLEFEGFTSAEATYGAEQAYK